MTDSPARIVVTLSRTGNVKAVTVDGEPMSAWTIRQEQAQVTSRCKYCNLPIVADTAEYYEHGGDQCNWRDHDPGDPTMAYDVTCPPQYVRPHEPDEVTVTALPDDVREGA